MRVLVVCSKTTGKISPFIEEQVNSLSKIKGIELRYFNINKKGILGYLSHLMLLYKEIHTFNPDLIHAHYGLSGLLANLQSKVPVVTTFHGSDINDPKVYKWSRWSHRLSSASIFVEKGMMKKLGKHHNSYLIPCGVDLNLFSPIPKNKARDILNLKTDVGYILLYSGKASKSNDYLLAKQACEEIEQLIGKRITILEMKGLTRMEVNLHMNSSECVLYLCSSGASPQFIKEAMSCCRPIVSTNVGNVSWLFESTKGCFITSKERSSLKQKLILAMNFEKEFCSNEGRERIIKLKLDINDVASKVYEVYLSILKYTV